MTINRKIEELESKFDLLGDFENEVVVRDNDKTVIYVGKAKDLHIGGDNSVRGEAILARYDTVEQTGNKIKLVKLFPPKFEIEKVPKIKKTKVWDITSGSYMHSYFIFRGLSETGDDFSHKYRYALRDNALHYKNLVLSPELLALVFNPIDKKIMEMYKQAISIK